MRSYIYQPGQLFVHDIIWSPDPVPVIIRPIHLNQGAMCGRYGVEITVSIFSIIFLIFIEGLPSALHFPQLIFRRIVPCLQITAKRVTPGESPLLALPQAIHDSPDPVEKLSLYTLILTAIVSQGESGHIMACPMSFKFGVD